MIKIWKIWIYYNKKEQENEVKMNQSSQSSSTLRDITTGAVNRLIVKGNSEDGKLRSKSMNGISNTKRMFGEGNDSNERSVSKLTRYHQINDDNESNSFSKQNLQRMSI